MAIDLMDQSKVCGMEKRYVAIISSLVFCCRLLQASKGINVSNIQVHVMYTFMWQDGLLGNVSTMNISTADMSI